jgi:quercetin dioxygenase-like cupin family protein
MSYETGNTVEYIEEVCGIYFRAIRFPRTGDRIPQHAHDHDHASLVCNGSVMVWVNGDCIGYFAAPKAIPIKAGAVHEFEAQEDNTLVSCVHDVASAESIRRKGL